MPKFEITYLVLPDFVFNNEKLTFMAAKVYAFIHNFRMEEFFYGNGKLMELFNCSEDSISRAIKLLEGEGYITTRFDGRKRFIEDRFRLRNFADADSAKMPTLNETGDSARLRMLNEASTGGANKNTNKKEYIKIGDRTDIGLNEDFLALQERKAERKARKKPFGFASRIEDSPRKSYPEKKPRKTIDLSHL